MGACYISNALFKKKQQHQNCVYFKNVYFIGNLFIFCLYLYNLVFENNLGKYEVTLIIHLQGFPINLNVFVWSEIFYNSANLKKRDMKVNWELISHPLKNVNNWNQLGIWDAKKESHIFVWMPHSNNKVTYQIDQKWILTKGNEEILGDRHNGK